MPLLDLKTNLKDLKFGHDEPEGGSSKQPYIATKIPATDESLQTGFSLDGGLKFPQSGTGGPDFLLRGGTLLPNAIADDVTRLGKFFINTEGLLFIVKQNLLSRLAVRSQSSPSLLNEGIYTPISTLLEAAGNPLGLHVNKQGLNPLEGLGGGFTPGRYFQNSRVGAIIEFKDWNRLYNLYSTKIITSRTFQRAVFNNIAIGDSESILSYSGGPDAPLGIGKTKIKYATDNFGSPLKIANVDILNNKDPQKGIIVNDIVGYATLGYQQIDEITNPDSTDDNIGNFKYPKVVDFRNKLRSSLNNWKKYTLISDAPSYNSGDNKTIEQRVHLGDPGNSEGKDLTSYVSGIAESTSDINYGAASKNSYDKINALSLYQSERVKSEEGNDLVKFRIGVLNLNKNSLTTKTYIHFRAFLDQITDSYTSEWDSIRYIGRGEKFYNYQGFDRKISLSWTVAAQSKAELIPMYQKLNYLASVCSPDYSEPGYMRGNIVTLTIGGYIYEQPGIITNLSYEMNDDNSTWEIAIPDGDQDPFFDPSVKELPHLIRVNNFSFIPIHNFVPRLQQNNFDDKGTLTSFSSERYIALNNGGSNNYDEINYIKQNTPRFS